MRRPTSSLSASPSASRPASVARPRRGRGRLRSRAHAWVPATLGWALAVGGGGGVERAAAQAPEVTVVAQCEACHAAAVAQWRTTAHARAGARLAPTEARDPRCLRCHVTAPARPDEGVGCAACHGPLAGHLARLAGAQVAAGKASSGMAAARPARGDDPQICARCHTDDSASVRPFDPRAALGRVRHSLEVR